MGDQRQTRDARRARAAPVDPARQPYYAKSWAVLIGIDDYVGRHASLANAVNDARAVETLLRDAYAFDEVIALYDEEATHDAIIALLREDLPARVGPDDRLMCYFAGHGTTRTSVRREVRGYLVPQDARLGGYADYIDMRELRDACGWIPAKHILIVLDCCFSGVAAITTRGEPGPPRAMNDVYLRTITERSAWQILTAGASDERVADSSSRPGHSAFTAALLDGLEGSADQNDDNLITASELAAYVRPRVARETRRESSTGQTPFFNYLAGSREGDFVFLLPGTEPQVPTAPQIVSRLPPVVRSHPRLWAAGALVLLIVMVLLGRSAWSASRERRRVVRLATAAAVTSIAERTHGAETLQAVVAQATSAEVERRTAVSEAEAAAAEAAPGPTRATAIVNLQNTRAAATVSVQSDRLALSVAKTAVLTLQDRVDPRADLRRAVPTPTGTATPSPTPIDATRSFPADRSIAFVSTRGGGTNLYVAKAEGERRSQAAQLSRATTEMEIITRLAYSCREAAFLFTAVAETADGMATVEVFRIGRDGRTLVNLTRDQEGHPGGASWSPLGDRIVYSSSAGDRPGNYLWVMNADGTGIELLTDSEEYDDAGPAWSPDGRWIAFAAVAARAGTQEARELFRIRADGQNRNRQQLTNTGWVNQNPAWSPDGQRLAFSCGGDICIMDADGGEPFRLLTQWDEDNPVWSPDGRWIAFDRRVDDRYKTEVFVVSADGEEEHRVTWSEADDWGPEWLREPDECAELIAS